MTRWSRIAVPAVVAAVMVVLPILPPGENAPAEQVVWEDGEDLYVYDPPPGMAEGRILGQLSLSLLLVSVALGYRFPGGWIRPSLRRRVHVWLGAAILLLSLAHGILLPAAGVFRGWHAGVLTLMALAVHGALGAMRSRAVARWGRQDWSYYHRASAWMGLLLGLEHTLLYGQHLGFLREAFYGNH